MILYLNILMLFLLETALSGPLTTPPRGCPTCEGKHSQTQPSVDLNATALDLGEPCGVYTPGCAHGLRCEPPRDATRPLRALLEGRGVCRNASSASLATQLHVGDSTPTEDPDQPPCRKLLGTLLRGLDAHVFQSHHDIYMPNCDKHGFFRKKQCWSSRGKHRGKCWCVDKDGTPVSPGAKQEGSLSC
ncbi:insulin-like growth factor-binding protein 3 [Cololabis saira]|uniref:insulin-like growth factor-binding protein 3 n=1 Tax=Cololabis saira TaxID=129043 RepID=UPI002AD33887|nr:insulin-like growth factor-binding protein 3 [Cololabis saira]XP_061583484.1 insulin-like growth factor-binding protein 3 [Cololabis saira]